MTLDERIEARFAELEDALDELLTLLLVITSYSIHYTKLYEI